MRRVVITGGAGFIGSHLCDRLLHRGLSVVCLDNLLTGSADNVAHLFSNPRFSFRHYDVTEYLYVEGEVHAILHFASPASPIDYAQMPIETLKVGTLGTHKALGLAKAKRARFLLASTSEVYGDPEVHPQPEDYWGNVNPVGPRGVYDEAKRAAETFVMAYHNAHGLDTRIARIFNTFGPRMRRNDGRAVPAFITQALAGDPLTVFGDGSQTRSLCYIDDLVEGLIRLLFSDYHLPVNLGNPGELTVVELAEMILELTGSPSPVVHQPLPVDDPRRRRPDISAAMRILGWTPQIPLRDGLERTIAWWTDGGPHARIPASGHTSLAGRVVAPASGRPAAPV